MNKATAFPGFESPGVGFEQPFEMLEACHMRVRRSLTLLDRLLEHIDTHGHDAQSRSAAADVLRYFDLAAPLHHADEETHVFPLLLDQGDAAVRATVRELQGDHQRMELLWAAVRQPLLRWREPGASEPADEPTRANLARFQALYASHIDTEEGQVYPAARTLMDATALENMGREMQARRQRR